MLFRVVEGVGRPLFNPSYEGSGLFIFVFD